MDGKEYRIAFLTVDWNYELVESTLHGLKRYVDDHKNVHLFAFDCFGKNLDNAKDRSEYAIFDLPDLSTFDGLMIQGNQIVLQRIREKLEARIARARIPAVSIGCPMDGCTLVRIENQRAQHDITEHVIRKHHAHRLVFITGILDNSCPEARQRRDGFMDACEENRIPRENITIIEGDWRNVTGKRIAEDWLEKGKKLPDAFICANDEMALGVVEVLKRNGYQVPSDVIVTGFDNLMTAELANPRLSTVYTDHGAENYMAMDVLIGLIDGTEKRSAVLFNYSIICSESCGCRESARPGLVRDKYFQQTKFLRQFYTMQDQMAEQLFEANNLPDIAEIIGKNKDILGCDDIYLCFNDYYYDNFDKDQWMQDSERYGREMILATGHAKGETVGYESCFTRFPTRDLLPGRLGKEERFLIFYPLHYNTYSIGYLAMDGISEAAKLNLHESIFNFLEIAIENVRKKELLRQFNGILDNLYVHDALTGLYNRFGYNRYAQDTFDRLMERDGSVQIMFTDMDDMKLINDTYGHDMGDEALKATTRILQKCCGQEDFLMRYGGDEFVIIAGGRDRELAQKIFDAAEKYNQTSGNPFKLGLSTGVYRTEKGDGKTLDECLKEADVMMYQIKTERKAGRL